MTGCWIIDDWMLESGGSATNDPVSAGNNWSVGHRRSLLSNGVATFFIGMTGTLGSSYTAVSDCNTDTGYSNAPAPRDELIAWPAPGYAPYKVVYPRWHAEWPSEIVAAKYGGNLHMDADTTVTVTRNGQSVPVYSESLAYGEYSRPLITFTLLGCATGADYDNVTLPQLLLGGPNIATAQAGNSTLDAPGAKAQVLSLFDTLAIPRFDSYPAAGTSGTLNELGFSPTRTLPDAPYHVKIDNIHIRGVAATGSEAAGSYTYYTNEELMSVEYDVTVFDPEAPAATVPAIAQQVVTKTGTSTMLAVGVSGGTIISGNAPQYQWYKCASPNAGNAGPGSSVASYIYNTYGSYGCAGAIAGWNTYFSGGLIVNGPGDRAYGSSPVSVTGSFQSSGGTIFLRCATVTRRGNSVSFTGATVVLSNTRNLNYSGIVTGPNFWVDSASGLLIGSLYLSGSNVASGTLSISSVSNGILSLSSGTVSINGGSATLSGGTASLNGCNLSLGNSRFTYTGRATLIPYTSPAAPSIPDAPATSTSNAGNSGTLVSGATQSYLNIIPTSAENYWVRVTNSLGTVSSDETTVSVYDPVVLTSQPTGGRFSPLNPQPLTVSARGGGYLTYQWYMNGRPVAGATGASYTPQANVEAIYVVTVTNGETYALSGPATVTWALLPSVSVPSVSLNPTFSNPRRGVPVRITATASGEGLSYQWYSYSMSYPSWLPAGNSPTIMAYQPSSKKGSTFALYYCTVTNSAGSVSSPGAVVMWQKKKK